MATDAQSLLNGSQCLNCYGPGGWPLIEAELLKLWAVSVNPGAATDPAVIISNAGGYNNYSAQSWLLKLGLLKNILNGVAPGMLTDPQFLLFANGSFCYNNFGPNMWALFDLGLLTDIVLQKNPAADTAPADLLTASKCYNNYSEQSWLVRLGLLQEISQAVNPSAPTDAASLMASASCYNCYGPGIWPLLEVQLLNLIFTNGGVIPPTGNLRITSDGNFRITSDGSFRAVTP